MLKTLFVLAYVTCLWPDRYWSLAAPNPTEEIPTEKVPDLQIGCEEGYSNEPSETSQQEKARKARSYFYRIETPASLISVWKPAYYRIQRPYYIPVYGADGQIPFYFPPQPIFINAGFPLDNPPVRGSLRPNQGYLPPKVDSTTENDMLDNRFGEENPVWDTSPSRTTVSPSVVIPTRRPKPARTTTVPPLIRENPSTVPPPSGGSAGRLEPEEQQIGQTTPRPSQCVWAIVNCCSAGSQSVSNSCFERFACPGPFWDRSPCESDFARIAIQSALNYYVNK